ncbi:MFS toxin efflux pump [Penicillium robsamsonii]|uniref:MFS toxin efflux pump n=1 Tax=Penicillium robsamsonii TaxID=1792511 RepID=UPI002547F94F|nr:MFS toxin efflux pump [Penicillium robsamsonii]KAJ5837021.1 MFS toxin efflux pump [Penicillium robsamsonii]
MHNTESDIKCENVSVTLESLTEEETVGLARWKLGLLMFGNTLAVFCVALDNTIMSNAIPRITQTFNSLEDIGWYSSVYFFTNCSVVLFFGKLYTHYSMKQIFLVALLLFEVGSLICGAAPTSVALIVGRAIAGLGAGGFYPVPY